MLCASFRWNVSARFNFGADVVDHRTAAHNRFAMIWRNQAGEERRFRYSDIAPSRELFDRLRLW
jgi:acyl-coenzyme A synthetase/AMP-(fatty) acid ligase